MTDYLEILEKLIGFETVSAVTNLEMIEWIGRYLQDFGVACHLTHDPAGSKANLFATLSSGAGGLILSGHTDVVPVAGQQWRSNPFVASLRDGKVYGRGACDMKGFIAVALSLVPEILASKTAEPVHLAFSYDEEVGCKGVPYLLADIARLGITPRGCIIGEPTDMLAVIGHKGAAMFRVTVKGLAVHSSLAPDGVNAIEYAALIIARLRRMGEQLCHHERRHEGFDISYTTIQVNRISGGAAGNIVAEHCEFMVDIRYLPGTDPDRLMGEIKAYIETDILPDMRKISTEADVTIVQVGDVPAFDIADDAPLVHHVQRALRTNGGCGYVAYGTEAGLFQKASIPTIICGPGSIVQAHRADEFVTLEQLEQCRDMLRNLIAGGSLSP